MDKLRIYVCGHDERLKLVKKRDFLRPVNLNELPIGIYQDNQISESRIFLSDIIQEPVEYIGFVTASWSAKYPFLPSLQKLDKLDYRPNYVWYANQAPVNATQNWSYFFEAWLPGTLGFIKDMSNFSGIPIKGFPPTCNTFICKWEVFQKFMEIWRPIFDYIYNKYPADVINKTILNGDKERKPGYVYECASTLTLSSLPDHFPGLEFKKIEPLTTKSRLPRLLV